MKHDRAAFAAYLAPFHDADTVGVAHNGKTCPLANWYRTLGYPHPFIDTKFLSLDWDTIGDQDEPLAEWEIQIIEQVDRHLGYVNAGTVREILARIPDEGVTA
jgi:hypothetical protein